MIFVSVVFYIREHVYADTRAVCCIYFAFIFHTCMNKHIDYHRKAEACLRLMHEKDPLDVFVSVLSCLQEWK